MTESMQPIHDQQPEDESQRLEAHLRQTAEKQFRVQMRQASQLLMRGDGKAALPLLERCYEFQPDDVDVLTNLGGAHVMVGQFDAAVPVLERATERAPDNPAVWSNLAAAYLGKMYNTPRERQEKALDAYRRIVEIAPEYPNVHYHMGLVHIERREWQDAFSAFSLAIEANPQDDDARRMLVRVLQVLNNPPDTQNN